jgi:hypothetical protein
MKLRIDPTFHIEYYNPEKALLYAILTRAIFDYCNVGFDISQFDSRQADAWIFSRNQKPWSFLWICSHLDLCPQRLRKFLLKTQKLEIVRFYGNIKLRRSFKKKRLNKYYLASAETPAP